MGKPVNYSQLCILAAIGRIVINRHSKCHARSNPPRNYPRLDRVSFVSSSGHLELGIASGHRGYQRCHLHRCGYGATVLSTIVVFHRDIFDLIKGLGFVGMRADYVVKILISAIPVVAIGLLFKEEIESLFSNNVLLVGVCFSLRWLSPSLITPHEGKEVGKSKAFLIGIAQACAVPRHFSLRLDHRCGTT